MPTRDELLAELTDDPAGIGYSADARGCYLALRTPRYKRWLVVPALDSYLKQATDASGRPLWLVLDAIRQGQVPDTEPIKPICDLLWDWLDKAARTAGSYVDPPLDAAYQWLSLEAITPALDALTTAGILTGEQRAEVEAMCRPRQARDELLWGAEVLLAEVEAAMGQHWQVTVALDPDKVAAGVGTATVVYHAGLDDEFVHVERISGASDLPAVKARAAEAQAAVAARRAAEAALSEE